MRVSPPIPAMGERIISSEIDQVRASEWDDTVSLMRVGGSLRPEGAAAEPPDGWEPPRQAGGFLVQAIAALVRRAEGYSFGNRLSRPWRYAARHAADPRVAQYRRVRAAQIIDAWIALCILIEVAFLVFDLPPLRVLGALLAALRILEIGAVWSYAVLFERDDFERTTGGSYTVVSVSRSLIHAVLMLGEVTLCFAIIANALRANIDRGAHRRRRS